MYLNSIYKRIESIIVANASAVSAMRSAVVKMKFRIDAHRPVYEEPRHPSLEMVKCNNIKRSVTYTSIIDVIDM